MTSRPRPDDCTRADAGAVMFVSLVLILMMIGVTMSTLLVVSSAANENKASREHLEALYAAETGVERAILDLSVGGTGTMGSSAAPLAFPYGEFWVTTTDNGNNTFTVLARGRANGMTRAIEATVVETGHIFHHAVFAGNSGGDPSYVMKFNGTSPDDDKIEGDVYSGGSIVVGEDATIDGTARATHGVTGTPDAVTGVTQPIFDIPAMGYETNHDVDVAQEFADHGIWQWDDAGGSAYQVPAALASHIFRKNPNDRISENLSTVKDDYYLEDPYEAVQVDANWDGTDAYMISIPGAKSAAANAKVRLVYFIDGNLWIHNIPTFSFKFESPPGGLEVTFVVKGDIMISDNIFYENPAQDGIALIAMKDPAIPNTGNIYFGDPRGGTIETMNAFMYAENNFYDINLSASGSKHVVVNGTMSAGNKVDIQRDFNGRHSQLEVHFDPRLRDGTLDLPGIPTVTGQLEYKLAAWRPVQNP